MEKRFVKVKKMVVPIVTLVMIASQLTGCTSASQKELISMMQKGQYIEIELDSEKPAKSLTAVNWKQLAELDDQQDLRSVIDDQLMILPFGDNLKNGVLYVDPTNGKWEPNNTLSNVYKNKKFIEYWKDAEKQAEIQKAVLDTYVDLDDASVDELKLAALNGYFNIFQDNEEKGYFNADSTLSRAQFMTGFVKANYQANDGVTANKSLTDKIGDNEYTVFAQYAIKNSFLSTEDGSLDKQTFNGTMTKAEAIYMIVKYYYSDEYDKATVKDKAYDDCENGGNMKEELGAKKDSKYVGSYILQNAINEEELPEELYKAMVVAKKHNLLGKETKDSNWNQGITKLEAMELLVNTLEDLGTTCEYERGSGDATTVAQNSGSLTTKKGAKLTKEQFSEETGLQGDRLDLYYDLYKQCISGGDSEEVAYKSVLEEIALNDDIASADTDNSNSGNTGNTGNTSRPSTSSSSGNSNGGSSSSNIENGTQNQNGEQVRSAEEAQAMLEQAGGYFITGSECDQLTDEERAAEEEAMSHIHGY